MITRVTTGLVGTGATLAAWGSVALSTVEGKIESTHELHHVVIGHMEQWLRIATMASGLATAIIAAYWMNKMNRVKLAQEEHLLCVACRQGRPPQVCPIETEDRPGDCPLNKPQKRKESKLMKKLRSLASILMLACIVALPATLVTVVPGCTTSAQRVSYNTIYSVEKTATAAYDGYIDQVIKGTLPTNDVPKISAAYNAVQRSVLVALDGVQYNTNALAPESLQIEAKDLTNLIEAIKAATDKKK